MAMNRTLAGVVGFALMVALVGCAGKPTGSKDPKITEAYKYSQSGVATDLPRPPKPDKQYTIGVALPHLANPHFVAQAYGYYDEAEKLGAKVVLFEAGGYQNLERQVKQVEDLISMPVDVIVLVAVNLEGTKAIVDEANKRGIPIVNVNVMTANDNVVTRIRSDDEAIGKVEADYLAKVVNGKANVMMISGAPGASYALYRPKGFREGIAKYPDIKILAEKFQDNSPEMGLKEMENALQAYKDITAVFTSTDLLALGAANALTSSGRRDKLPIITVDPSADTVQAIKDGRISATVVQASVEMGRWGVRAAILAAEGKADQLKKQYFTPLNLVDKTNADTFQFEGVSRPPAGWTMPSK